MNDIGRAFASGGGNAPFLLLNSSNYKMASRILPSVMVLSTNMPWGAPQGGDRDGANQEEGNRDDVARVYLGSDLTMMARSYSCYKSLYFVVNLASRAPVGQLIKAPDPRVYMAAS
jgi:hypothetical protein